MRTFKDLRKYKMSPDERSTIDRLLSSAPAPAQRPAKDRASEQMDIPPEAYIQVGKGGA